jgi:hypothetical protein
MLTCSRSSRRAKDIGWLALFRMVRRPAVECTEAVTWSRRRCWIGCRKVSFGWQTGSFNSFTENRDRTMFRLGGDTLRTREFSQPTMRRVPSANLALNSHLL